MFKQLTEYFSHKMDRGAAQTLAFVIAAVVWITAVILCEFAFILVFNYLRGV